MQFKLPSSKSKMALSRSLLGKSTVGKEGGRSQVPCGAQMFLLDVLEEGMRQSVHRGWQQGDIHCSDDVEKPSLIIEMAGWVLSGCDCGFSGAKNGNRSMLVFPTPCL